MKYDKCPYCGSDIKYASKRSSRYPNHIYMTPVIFQCGTVASKNWSPPVRSKTCGAANNKV